MIGNKPHENTSGENESVDSSDAKRLLSTFLDVEAGKLGISVIKLGGILVDSDVQQQLKCENFILFATTPDMLKNSDDDNTFEELLKEVIAAERNKKTNLIYITSLNSKVEKVLNDLLQDMDNFSEPTEKEVKLIGVNQKNIVKVALSLFRTYKDTITVSFYQDPDDGILRKICERSDDVPTIILYAYLIDVLRILNEIKKDVAKEIIIKKEDTEKTWEIINKVDTAKLCVVAPYKNQDEKDLSGAKRE